MLNVKFWVLVVVVVVVPASHLTFFSPSPPHTEIKSRHGNQKPADLGSSEMVLFLREAIRAAQLRAAYIAQRKSCRAIAAAKFAPRKPRRHTAPILSRPTSSTTSAYPPAL